MPIEMHKKAHLDKECWCTGWKHWHYKKEAIDTLALHQTIENRIKELPSIPGRVVAGISRQKVLEIIEEEFGRLTVDYIR